MIHQKIFQEPSKNRDFILSLHSDLAYNLAQLWDARAKGNETQWLHFLGKLATTYGGDVEKVHGEWHALIENYRKVEEKNT